ncbi:MAG: hypothetical protein JEY71_00320 [Sphaerochaeta sp.]|nr:hypothetical protein [Sphaerochaeta sp.]
MKMKLTFLLLASVFFVSCGMPTIFNLSTSEYSLQSIDNSDTDKVEGNLAMQLNAGPNFDLLEDSSVEGPSLMFFYTFGGELATSYDLTSSIGTIQSEFKRTFIKNTYEGIPVSNPNELLSITKNTDKIFLYGVNNSAGTNFNASGQYVLYSQNLPSKTANLAALDSFSLTKTDLVTPANTYTLDLSRTKASTSPAFISNATAPLNKLYAFDGQPFTSSRSAVQNKIDDPNNHEYNYVGDNPSNIQIHLFAAFFIAGPFSNYFWSDLLYLGAIPITLQ